jgi:hypothetical protein
MKFPTLDGLSHALRSSYMLIWTIWYNCVRIHKSLRVTPAMQAGLTDRLWSFEEIVAGMDAIAPKAGRPKPIKNSP